MTYENLVITFIMQRRNCNNCFDEILMWYVTFLLVFQNTQPFPLVPEKKRQNHETWFVTSVTYQTWWTTSNQLSSGDQSQSGLVKTYTIYHVTQHPAASFASSAFTLGNLFIIKHHYSVSLVTIFLNTQWNYIQIQLNCNFRISM